MKSIKTLFLSIAAAAAVLLSSSASAQLIIYKGTLRGSFYGQGMSQKINSGFYLVVDYSTANIAEIQYMDINGAKYFNSYTETNLHFMEMSGPNGKTLQAISRPPNSCDTSEGITSDSVFLKGTTSLLAVNTNLTISFPRVLSGGGRGIDTSGGGPTYVESTLVVNFNGAQTLISNENSDTLDAATARITGALQAQGYSQMSEKGKSAGSVRELFGAMLLK